MSDIARTPETKYAVISLVTGILSLFIPLIGIVLAIVAIVYYKKQKRIAPDNRATIGLVLGSITIAIHIIFLLIVVGFAFFGVMSPEKLLPSRPAPAENLESEYCIVDEPFSCAYSYHELYTDYTQPSNVSNTMIFQIFYTIANSGVSLPEVSITYDCETVRFETPFTQTFDAWSRGGTKALQAVGCKIDENGFVHGTFVITYSGGSAKGRFAHRVI